MNQFRLLDTGHLPAAANMALDEIVLDQVANGWSPPTLRFLQFRPEAALVGYNQDVGREIREDYCLEKGISINRRITGGGAIFFQESAIGWELFGQIGPQPFHGNYERIVTRICSAVAKAISDLGIEAAFRPRNDIEVNGRKISGAGAAALENGIMVQGTLLVENDIESFVKALRVPVEKLKKRELESLLDRICFLNDLARTRITEDHIKGIIAKGISRELGITLIPGDLTIDEKSLLEKNLPYYSSTKWTHKKSSSAWKQEPLKSVYQTDTGTIQVHLWPSKGFKRIETALISGDFFAYPERLILDLESHLRGLKLDKASLEVSIIDFMDKYHGEIVGISSKEIAQAISRAVERLAMIPAGFDLTEANELFFVNTEPGAFYKQTPRWLLLPYCSKDLGCPFRSEPGCDECGDCEIGECVNMAHNFDMAPYTVQSFEHLMEILNTKCKDQDGLYVGSCCEAFYSKHQKEMEQINAKGVLINLDSTTCYDLGKGTLAYHGKFDNKTSLNLHLLEKTLRVINENRR